MDIADVIGFVSMTIMLVVAGWLALWCKYDDGIFGKICLGMIAIGSLVVLIELSEGIMHRFTPNRALVVAGVAGFLLRHLWRAWLFVRKEEADARKQRKKS